MQLQQGLMREQDGQVEQLEQSVNNTRVRQQKMQDLKELNPGK